MCTDLIDGYLARRLEAETYLGKVVDLISDKSMTIVSLLYAAARGISIFPLALIAIFHFGTREAERWLVAEMAEHRAALDALRGGRWPDGHSGQKVAALAGRLDAEAAKRIRRYWELQAWLVAEAEETMMEEATGDAVFNPAEVRAAFAELDGLKRALGRSTFAALRALLPFSRNDQWEVAELRQRLSRR